MDNAIWIALLGIVGGLGSAAYSNRLAVKTQRDTAELARRDRERQREMAALHQERERERTEAETVEDLLKRYRDPLLRASFDLQSRMYNIVARQFLETYHVDERPDTKAYACENTLFVLAEFLGWVEILRREVRFLDLGVEAQNKAWVEHLRAVRNALQFNTFGYILQILNGHQRAIGEVMIHAGREPGPELPTAGDNGLRGLRHEAPGRS